MMSTLNGIDNCPFCGEESLYMFDNKTSSREYFCENPDCEANMTELEVFLKALSQDDFAKGDSFWIEGFEFTVTEVPVVYSRSASGE